MQTIVQRYIFDMQREAEVTEGKGGIILISDLFSIDNENTRENIHHHQP